MPTHVRTRTTCSDPEYLLLSFAAGMREYALLLLDPDGCIVSWNDGAEHLSGYLGHEVIGRHFSCIYPPDDVAAGKPARDLEAARTGHHEDISERLRKNGSRFLAHTVTTLINEIGRAHV